VGRIRIVLVEPREGGNVGAVARVMKNFGLDDLWIVGEVPPLQPVATWWASGADDLVASIRTTPSLELALADCVVTVATSSSRGRNLAAPATPARVRELVESLSADQSLALVFGREDRGLTSEETALCQMTAVVPTNPEFPTMNLAQTVTVFAYEAFGRREHSTEPRDLAPNALVERLHDRAAALLLEVGFLHEENPERIYADLRSVMSRASLDRREAEMALGIIKQIEWKLQQRSEPR
jgi:tRNA/rRNA methyltransferase